MYFLKKLIVISSVFIFIKPIFPIFEYLAYYDYISEVLCINKEKEQLECNGKCHLMKRLNQTHQDQNPISSNDIKKYELDLFLFNRMEFNLNYILKEFKKNKKIYLNLYSYFNISDILKPPIFFLN